MISNYLDLTDKYNNSGAAGLVNIDMGSFNSTIVHIINNSTTISFKASNDGGAIEPASQGNSIQAINFVAVEGTNLSTLATATSIAATPAPGTIWRFDVVGKYLQLSGGGTVSKLLIQQNKIQ